MQNKRIAVTLSWCSSQCQLQSHLEQAAYQGEWSADTHVCLPFEKGKNISAVPDTSLVRYMQFDQFHTSPANTIQYNTIQYNTIHKSLWQSEVQWSIKQ
jgi:hypothetical protein